MARGLNKVQIIGNLGDDPKVTKQNNFTVAHISVATSISWQDKQTGEKKEKTEWHRIVFFNRLAEIVEHYLRKGSQVYVEGSLRTNKWKDKEGVDRYNTEIVAREMQMLGGKREGGQAQEEQNPYKGAATQAQENPEYQPEFDDDIPF